MPEISTVFPSSVSADEGNLLYASYASVRIFHPTGLNSNGGFTSRFTLSIL